MSRRVRPNKFLQVGLPFIGFVAVGSVGLSVLVQGRKDAIDAKSGPVDERIPADKIRRKQFDLNTEYEVCVCTVSHASEGTVRCTPVFSSTLNGMTHPCESLSVELDMNVR
eukprot:1704298-Pyramimonas_sp.AAC.1